MGLLTKKAKQSGTPQKSTLAFRIYKDSKELPLWNYKRILQTEDFFYMIKDYDGEEINADVTDLEEKFTNIIKDFAFSLNNAHADILQFGKIESLKIKINLLVIIHDIIAAKVSANIIRHQLEMDIDNSIIDELLENVKITKVDDLIKQAEIIKNRIVKYQNDIAEAQAKLDKNQTHNENKEFDIDEIILATSLMLEYQIDERKTTLYQFGILQEQARKKGEQLQKLNQKK